MKDKLKWSRENCPLPRTCPVRLDQKVMESVELTSKLTHQKLILCLQLFNVTIPAAILATQFFRAVIWFGYKTHFDGKSTICGSRDVQLCRMLDAVQMTGKARIIARTYSSL